MLKTEDCSKMRAWNISPCLWCLSGLWSLGVLSEPAVLATCAELGEKHMHTAEHLSLLNGVGYLSGHPTSNLWLTKVHQELVLVIFIVCFGWLSVCLSVKRRVEVVLYCRRNVFLSPVALVVLWLFNRNWKLFALWQFSLNNCNRSHILSACLLKWRQWSFLPSRSRR